jgi:hypothetical protein
MSELLRIEQRLLELTGAFDLRPSIQKASDIGDLLIEARSLVAHGEWADWLAHLGLHRRTAWDYMSVAKAREANVWPATQMSIKGFIRYVRRAKHAQRESERAEARELARRARGELPENIVLAHADCRHHAWPENIDLIVADPPWNEPAHYQWIATWAAKHLREGGLALVQCGQHLLPEVMAILGAHLNYVWTMSIVYSESSGTVAKGKFRSIWKPVLAFSRGKAQISETVADAYHMHVAGTDKALHPWEQPLAPWRYWLSRLTTSGQTVADAYAGSGTIGVVCKEVGLRYIGTEVDEKTFRVAWGRISREIRQHDKQPRQRV